MVISIYIITKRIRYHEKTKRRDFLKQFFWGSALLYVNPITFSTSGKAITDKANNLPTDEITRKQALTYFYKKEYKNAENLFNKLISVHPDKISYYDGLRKVLELKTEYRIFVFFMLRV